MKPTVLLLALVLAGCGGQAPASGTASGTNGPLYAEASPSHLAAGGTVHLTLTATGPIDYEVGCVQTLHIWAEDRNQRKVWEQPVPAIMCMAFGHRELAAGEEATFTAVWPTQKDLARGSYTLHGLFRTVLPQGATTRVRENLPPLTVELFR